jgi:hypothetical protein
MLPAARGALDERRLVGTTASDLNTLAGARGGTVGATLRTRRRRNQTPASRRHDVWGSARLPQGGEAPLPLPWGLGRRCGCSRRCHRRTPSRLRGARWHLSGTRRHLRGARRFSHGLPGDGRSCARPKRCLLGRLRGSGRGGAGSHLSGRARPPLLPSSSSSSDDEYSEVTGEDSLAAHAAGTPHSSAPGAPVAGSSSPSCVPPAPVPATTPRARSRLGRGRVGPRGVHGHQLQGISERSDLPGASQENGGRED